MISVAPIRADRGALVTALRDAGGEIVHGTSVKCPFHDDTNASGSIFLRDDVWKFHCHVCSITEDAIGVMARATGRTCGDVLKGMNGSPANGNHRGANGRANGTPKPRKTHATMQDVVRATEWMHREQGGKFGGQFLYEDHDRIEYAREIRIELQGGDKKFVPIRTVTGGWQIGDPEQWYPFRLPEMLNAAEDRPNDPVVITEGGKACNAAAAAGLVAVTSAHGAKAAAKTGWGSLAGRSVIILPDNDEPGRQYAEDVAGILCGLTPPARIKIIELPGLPEGGDYVEYAAAGGTAEQVLRLADEAPEWKASPAATEPESNCATVAQNPDPTPGESSNCDTVLQYQAKRRVQIDTDEHRVSDEVIEALASDPDLFKRGEALARVLTGERRPDGINRPGGAPTIAMVSLPWLRERITQRVDLYRIVERGEATIESKAHPPQWLPQAIDARKEWPFRELVAVSESPVLRPDGTIHQAAGYDGETGVVFIPAREFPAVPTKPTRDQATAALDRLDEIVCDYRFETPAHKSSWLASLLTMLGRHAYQGPTPCFLVDANIRGAGKGLLCHATAIVATGHELPICGYCPEPIEMAKRLTSVAISGDPVILLDNIAGTFGNDALDRALTATRWKERILGLSKDADCPWLTIILATGNNVLVAADTARRIIHIRLDVMDEKPEERDDFRHPDLLAWVRQNRATLLVDGLTVLSAYIRAGRPDQHLTPYGSFEGWSALVRGAIAWCGRPDPCETRASLTATADTTAGLLAQLMGAWQQYDPGNVGLVAAELVANLYPSSFAPTAPEAVAMRAAIEALVGCPPGKSPSVRQVGNRLKSFRRRVLNNLYLDIEKDRHSSAGAVWRLFGPKNAGASESVESGECFSPPYA